MKKLLFVLCLLVSHVPYSPAISDHDRELYAEYLDRIDRGLAEFVKKSDGGDGEASYELYTYYSILDKDELARYYLFKSAKQEYSRSFKSLATAYERGELGISKDYKEAIKWYSKAQSCENNSPIGAAFCVNTFYGLYSIYQKGWLYNFWLSKKQLYLAGLNERKDLKIYFEEINDSITMRPPGSKVDIDLVKVVAADGGMPKVLGVTSRRYGDKTVSNRIEIYFDEINKSYPYLNTEESFWWRQVQLVNTCVHQLAHVFFSQRYPLIANCSKKTFKKLYVGYATYVAYEYMKREFFSYNRNDEEFTPAKYAAIFLSDEYKEYFFWFRANCLMPDEEEVMWYKIDDWEREAARGQEPFTRTQEAWKD